MMLSTTQRKMAELTLIFAVPIISDAHEKSRLAGLQRKLQDLSAKELGKLHQMTHTERLDIIEHIEDWGNQTGWLNNKKSIGTLLSFIAELIEKSQFEYNPKILQTVNELIAHLENGKEFKIQSCWAGSLAAERWEGMFN
jgi:hypothetical protein